MTRPIIGLMVCAAVAAAAPEAGERLVRAQAAQRSDSGWRLPREALDLKNPLPVDDKRLAAGRELFLDKCRKCHGPKGLGDGPDADPEYADSMNLTNPRRANRNPDGIVFYKVLYGRSDPKMPAFGEELSRDQIWTVVAYVQSLRGR